MQGTEQKADNCEALQSFKGTWHNQNSSELDLLVDHYGRVSGTFTMFPQTDSETGDSYDVTGFATADIIAFCVRFPDHECVTAWSGLLYNEDAEERLSTMWHMTASTHHDNAKLWKATWTGADVFRRGNVERRSEINQTPSYPFWPIHGQSR